MGTDALAVNISTSVYALHSMVPMTFIARQDSLWNISYDMIIEPGVFNFVDSKWAVGHHIALEITAADLALLGMCSQVKKHTIQRRIHPCCYDNAVGLPTKLNVD